MSSSTLLHGSFVIGFPSYPNIASSVFFFGSADHVGSDSADSDGSIDSSISAGSTGNAASAGSAVPPGITASAVLLWLTPRIFFDWVPILAKNCILRVLLWGY